MELFEACVYLAGPIFTWILITTIRKKRKITNIPERRVFITGCDTGFGRSLALRLDSQGVWVYAGCLRHNTVDELSLSCSKRLKAVVIDVTNTESIQAAAELVKSDLDGRALWAIVNNAGVLGSRVPYEWTTRQHCREILEVNLLGMYDVTLAFLPLMRNAKQGRIVNMSSLNGRLAISAHGYTISKFGVEGFSDGLCYDVKPFNITVHVIEPGLFKTPLVNKVLETDKIKAEFRKCSVETQECYGEEYLNKYIEYVTTMFTDGASLNTRHVIDAYEHAILGKYPKYRYLVGPQAKYVGGPVSYLPMYLQMFIFESIEKLMGTSVPLPQSCLHR